MMTLQRVAVGLLGLLFVVLVGMVVWSTITDDEGRPLDAPVTSASDRESATVDSESVSPSGSVGRALAGFVLITGWSLGVIVVIARARRRGSKTSANGTTEDARAGG